MSEINIENLDFINESYDNINKSAEDKRNYRGLVLRNGLKVLLISDPVTETSAAALDVCIGSMSDPRAIPGLAHFVEHMLFLGTDKYPDENDYDRYISKNGGYNNASTSDTHTNYHFGVCSDGLTGALNRFAQFFLQPLFTESATDREIQSVNSEHENDIPNDDSRFNQLEKSLCDPSHDFNKFGTGNIETLKETPLLNGINVREALIKFHKDWYSANMMSLVVLGKESIEELVELIIPLFSRIKTNSALVPEWPTHPFSDQYLRKQIFIVPIEDLRSLYITFPTPDMVSHYKSQPEGYISGLIGHEGPGSLLSELKARGLGTSLFAYYIRGGKGFGFFRINIYLTEEGIDRIDEIITLIFQYINLLKREGPKQWIYEEMKRINEIDFRLKGKEGPISYVEYLSSKLQDCPITECLTAGYLLEDYRPDLITDVLKHLTPDRIRVTIMGQKFNGMTDSVEKFYGTQYKMIDIPEEKLNLWKNCGLNDNLTLPPINDFIASDLRLKNSDKTIETIPEIIRNTEFTRLWYLGDNQYLKPKVIYGFVLTNPIVYTDPFHENLTDMFTRLFRESLKEYSYSAELAGISYMFNYIKSGLILHLSGYNDKLDILLTKILNKLIDFTIDSKMFEVFKEVYIRELRDYTTQSILQLLPYYTSFVTTDRYWSYEELLESANELTVDKVMQFIPQLFSHLHIEALIHGNIEKSEALGVCDLVEDKLKSGFRTKPIALSQHFRNREIRLNDGQSYSFETTTPIHETNAILVYFQVGVQSTLSNALLELLKQLIKEPFYNRLRTQEQLGYILSACLRRDNGVQGMTFIIQSDSMPSYLNDRIEAFISWAEQYIQDMSDEEFEKEKRSLISRKLVKPKQMIGLSTRLWNEIVSKQYDFNRHRIEANLLKELTKADIISFFNKHISSKSENRKKLMVTILSASAVNEINSNEFKDKVLAESQQNVVKKIEHLIQFKNSLGVYPLPQPYVDIYRMDPEQ